MLTPCMASPIGETGSPLRKRGEEVTLIDIGVEQGFISSEFGEKLTDAVYKAHIQVYYNATDTKEIKK